MNWQIDGSADRYGQEKKMDGEKGGRNREK